MIKALIFIVLAILYFWKVSPIIKKKVSSSITNYRFKQKPEDSFFFFANMLVTMQNENDPQENTFFSAKQIISQTEDGEKEIAEYDRDGNHIHNIYITPNGESELSKNYDRRGNCIEFTHTSNFSYNVAYEHYFCTYDMEGNFKAAQALDKKGKLLFSCATRYRTGKIDELTLLDVKERLMRRKTYQYNEKGDCVEESLYIDGKLNDQKISSYDEEHNMVESRTYNEEGRLDFKSSYRHQGKRLVESIEEWYDTNEQGKNVLKSTITRHFNEQGDEIEELSYYPEDKTYSNYKTSYTYDDRGMWTTQTSEHTETDANGEVTAKETTTETRTIEYYD